MSRFLHLGEAMSHAKLPEPDPKIIVAASAKISGLLETADKAWMDGKRQFSIGLYDRALQIAERFSMEAQIAEISLGKGFALLQMPCAETTGQQSCRREALSCLDRAKAFAVAHGNVEQLSLVNTIFTTSGHLDRALPARPEHTSKRRRRRPMAGTISPSSAGMALRPTVAVAAVSG